MIPTDDNDSRHRRLNQEISTTTLAHLNRLQWAPGSGPMTRATPLDPVQHEDGSFEDTSPLIAP
jgi:hypothetical protein